MNPIFKAYIILTFRDLSTLLDQIGKDYPNLIRKDLGNKLEELATKDLKSSNPPEINYHKQISHMNYHRGISVYANFVDHNEPLKKELLGKNIVNPTMHLFLNDVVNSTSEDNRVLIDKISYKSLSNAKIIFSYDVDKNDMISEMKTTILIYDKVIPDRIRTSRIKLKATYNEKNEISSFSSSASKFLLE